MGVAVLVLVQPRGLVDFPDLNALVAHLPGEAGAIPGFGIGHQPPDDARFAPGTTFAALMDADLNILFHESARRWAGLHAEITARAGPAGIVFEEFVIVVARGDELHLAALDVLRDFVEKLLILPALEGFDQRIDAGVAGVGRGQQVDDRDPAQPQIGFDIHRLDAVAAQPV
ncbi:MAG TPA: hypothetical protein PKD09_19070 [Aggregatilinea sp.]|uniref:hypothetical protein n=1 Tax=Aggregatilinea sp. TaxID=2806333 RepID=UPI002CF92466|nr:hypothetical protein [Aggregatilinea sp.]HML23766.1 hypothetical protein [Aggregatilinea sp.]